MPKDKRDDNTAGHEGELTAAKRLARKVISLYGCRFVDVFTTDALYINYPFVCLIKKELFPSLIFCEGVVTQIRELRIGNPMLRVVVKRLFELEDYCKNWHEGPFNPDNLPTKVTPESQVTLQQFGGERTFLCPDGQKRIFSWHVRLTPAAWRIYFFPEEGIKEIIIGYIGPHLPTARYPT